MMQVCGGCHGLEFNVTPRSKKAWELTVANMRVYAQNGANPFSEADADRVVNYLDTYFGEGSNLNPAKHFELIPDAAPSAVDPQPPAPETRQLKPETPPPAPARPAPAKLAPLSRPDLPPAIRERLEHPGWRPPRALKRTAEVGGYLAVACTLTLLLSGHNRWRLGRRFRPLHIFAALGLFLGLATHAIIYLCQYGTPPVLWYWFGVGSFLVIVLAQVQGLIRKRFGRVFLRIHLAAGYSGLILAVCHWIWAWL